MMILRRMCILAMLLGMPLLAQRSAPLPANTDTSATTSATPATTQSVSAAPKVDTATPTTSDSSANTPAPPAQSSADLAPAAMTNKIADLVHSGQYAQAKQLTTGLMIAYPNDQRLVKANALIDQLMAAPVKATPTVAPNPADQLSGMDKIDYSALIDLAKQAQETSDLEERHPEQMLI
jgi:hypothetical protein